MESCFGEKCPRGITLTISDLYQEFEKGLRRYAHRLTSDAGSSDDLVQATFMRAMTHLGLHEGTFLDSTKTEEEAVEAPEESDRRIENANIWCCRSGWPLPKIRLKNIAK